MSAAWRSADSLRATLARQHLEAAQHGGGNGEVASHYEAVMKKYADPTSPMYAVAQRGLDSLKAASGQ